ncbi:30S ribosomal protein THX [Algoriphagus namhaensis]|uniref:30S ribosomal protein THX n=1 Tax=Algoriphagus namhaensis TaxID=915353 RepID=A0ABV8AWY3_9BACT
MGKGDMKTKKGKINRGTYGASRPRKAKNKHAEPPKPKAKKK